MMCVPGSFSGVSDCIYLGGPHGFLLSARNSGASAVADILRITLRETQQLSFSTGHHLCIYLISFTFA